MNKSILIVFAKNPELGKVKTRLAQTIGNEKALEVYEKLLHHTLTITKKANAKSAIYFSDNLSNLTPDAKNVSLHLQRGNDLGERMLNAFSDSFKNGYKQVIIIGSDCYDLTTEIINTAFEYLKEHSLVIGPAKDGGYYLIGMNVLFKDLFINKEWSTETVLNDTLADAEKLNINVKLLPVLSDIDNENDLKNYPELLK